MSRKVIEVDNVTKQFKLRSNSSKELKTLFLSKEKKHTQIHQVLNGISFDVYEGEAIALIGKNGCGKSTTLKLLTKIIRPTSGTLKIAGRVSSLIELGAGFHPDMSGRENIYINASIFGLTTKEVNSVIEEIIAFSELEEFIDNPVRTYSSGMYMRLAFAVAIHVNADVLLIDEILAVGDAAFQAKCFARLKELKANGVTIVLVSHSISQIKQICNRVIWIEEGKIKEDGKTDVVCEHYISAMDAIRIANMRFENDKRLDKLGNSRIDGIAQLYSGAVRTGTGEVRFTNVELCNSLGERSTVFCSGEDILIRCVYESSEDELPLSLAWGIINDDGVNCYRTSTHIEFDKMLVAKKQGDYECMIKHQNLGEGVYYLDVRAWGDQENIYDSIHRVIEFRIEDFRKNGHGVMCLDTQWSVKE